MTKEILILENTPNFDDHVIDLDGLSHDNTNETILVDGEDCGIKVKGFRKTEKGIYALVEHALIKLDEYSVSCHLVFSEQIEKDGIIHVTKSELRAISLAKSSIIYEDLINNVVAKNRMQSKYLISFYLHILLIIFAVILIFVFDTLVPSILIGLLSIIFYFIYRREPGIVELKK